MKRTDWSRDIPLPTTSDLLTSTTPQRRTTLLAAKHWILDLTLAQAGKLDISTSWPTTAVESICWQGAKGNRPPLTLQ